MRKAMRSAHRTAETVARVIEEGAQRTSGAEHGGRDMDGAVVDMDGKA